MKHFELVERIRAIVDDGLHRCSHPNTTTDYILAEVLKAVQEPSEAMEAAHDEAHAKAITVFASTRNVWQAMLAASPLTPEVET